MAFYRNDRIVFLCPSDVSNKWKVRFVTLEFTFDIDGYLYSPKRWNDGWDLQTKALWLRSIGISPERIATKLNVKLTTVKNRWIDNITRHYKLKSTINTDWATIGYIDIARDRYITYGGISRQSHLGTGQEEMDGELMQVRHDYFDTLETLNKSEELNPSDDLYKKYYGDYKG